MQLFYLSVMAFIDVYSVCIKCKVMVLILYSGVFYNKLKGVNPADKLGKKGHYSGQTMIYIGYIAMDIFVFCDDYHPSYTMFLWHFSV